MLTFGNVIIFACLLVLVYIYLKRKFNYFKNKGVLHRKVVIPFGNLLDVVFYNDRPAKYFAELYNEFNAPYVGFYAMTSPFLMLKDPEIIKRVLIKDFNVFPNRCFHLDKKIDPIISNALFSIENPEWKQLRKKISPVFTSGKIKMMTPLMVECGKNLESYLSDNLYKNMEMKDVCAKYTTDVITSCAFGLDANSFNDDSVFRHYGKLVFPTTPLRALKALTYVFAPIFVKIFKYTFMDKTAIDFFRKIFLDTLRSRKLNPVKRNDLVNILNEIEKEEDANDNFKFDEDVIFAQALTFFAAGHETTSSTMAFTLHELSVNTDIQDKLREEIHREIIQYGGITYEAIQNMTYLNMIISETLRKYPLTPFLHRKAVENYKIPETGLMIEKGTAIFISQVGLHWDPQHFPNPEKFDPERFNEQNKQNIPNYVYLPFGDGPRNCIGDRFALLSSKLGIIHFIQSYKIERNSDTREPLVFGRSTILQSKYGIPLTCTRL